MAAPVPANATIAALQAATLAAGREFDVAHANMAPRPIRYPPASPIQSPWNGPAPQVTDPAAGAAKSRYCVSQHGSPRIRGSGLAKLVQMIH